MVHTWIADISPLKDEDIYEKYYKNAPDFRREKADRLRFPEDRARSIGAWALWERMQLYYGLDPGAVFNLSHSGDFVMCSVSAEENIAVGCDIETVKEMRMKVAERFFLPGETGYIKEQTTVARQTEIFYRIWVLKESFMKAVRRGMALDTRSFEIGFDKNDMPFLLHQPAQYREKYFYREYSVCGVKAKMAVCSTDEEFGEIHAEVLE